MFSLIIFSNEELTLFMTRKARHELCSLLIVLANRDLDSFHVLIIQVFSDDLVAFLCIDIDLFKHYVAGLVAQLDALSDWRPGGLGFNPR